MSYSLLTEEEWAEEELKDPEEGIGHNRDLYVVWHEKSNFLKIASDNNFYNSSYFLWLDIGALRHKVVKLSIIKIWKYWFPLNQILPTMRSF